MLLKLTIENYALIERLDITLEEGFSVITGETGAGKSILLGALSLLLGQRADTSVLLEKSRKCVVEGSFLTAGYNLDNFFSENELDNDRETILRREINPAGKSRAFINDTPVNLQMLKELGDRLVNIHSQHAVITLNDADFQLAVIDSYAGNSTLLEEYRIKFNTLRKTGKVLEELISSENKARAEQDYHQFLFNELEEANLQENEQEETEKRLEFLNHAEEIKNSLVKVLNYISEGEDNILNNLSHSANLLSQVTDWHPDLKDLSDRLKSNLIDIKDISAELGHLEQKVVFDPEEIAHLSARLDIIYHLQRKHNVNTVAALLTIKNDLSDKLNDLSSLSEKITELGKMAAAISEELNLLGSSLTENRRNVCPEMEKQITEMLSKLGMPHAAFSISLASADKPGPYGNDHARFLFSANKGIALSEVAKIASGGELSRLMLSIKSLISSKNLLPTIIFDEIDNGVSGEVAGKVGQILESMGRTMQVIAITHLPQIAGQGRTHYQVYKSSSESSARTNIRKLQREERINEIAKMLSNEKVTDAALITAKELLLN